MPLLAMKDVKLAVNHDALRLLHKINQLLAAEGVPAYLVGGFLRDWLLGRETADIDIAVGAEALAVARKIAAALGGKYIPLDAENGIGRVVISGETCHFDFSTIGGDIQQDLGRRDFTINAMALPLDESFGESLDSARLIDPFGGRDDLDHRILKVTNPGVFAAEASSA
jgi:poly(A) polymerase